MSIIQSLAERQEQLRTAQEKYFESFREKTQQSYTQSQIAEEQAKICSRCKEPKMLTEFWKHKGTKDGLQYTCKDCRREYDRGRLGKRKAKINKYVEEKRELIALLDNQPIVLYSDDFLVNALIITNVGWCATLLALLWVMS